MLSCEIVEMTFITRSVWALFTVKKITGGRLWNKPWGLPKFTKGQKRNKRHNDYQTAQNKDVIILANLLDPGKPVRTKAEIMEEKRKKEMKKLNFLRKKKKSKS